MTKKITKKEIQELAHEIRKYLVLNDLWHDCRIYFNGKCFDSNMDGGKGVIDNISPHDYFEYAGDILSMSFEGELYEILNYEWGAEYLKEFESIFYKHGCYYELGNSWNLTTAII